MNIVQDLEYDTLEPGCAPKYGVSVSPSSSFDMGAKYTVAWFVSLDDAKRFAKNTLMRIWDLEEGQCITE